ncbi:hypothetical protein Btru_008599 [Bulinus truncatus]|nr:hypothetical protein Btru_008599 [Bulinus truncatus]
MRVSRSIDRVSRSIDRVSRSIDRVSRSIDRVSRSIDRVSRSIDRVSRSIDRVSRSIDRAPRSIDRVSRSIDRVSRSIDRVSRSIDRVSRSIDRVSRSIDTSCPHVLRAPTVIAMVGLPARGKTYISKKLTRYLNWIGVTTKVFNVGEYRRAKTDKYRNHDFFRPENKEAQELRSHVAMLALEDAAKYLEEGGGEVAEVKVCSPDYLGMDKNTALEDFLKRIEHYKQEYEALDYKHDKDISFIQIFNQGERFIVNRLAEHNETVAKIFKRKSTKFNEETSLTTICLLDDIEQIFYDDDREQTFYDNIGTKHFYDDMEQTFYDDIEQNILR